MNPMRRCMWKHSLNFPSTSPLGSDCASYLIFPCHALSLAESLITAIRFFRSHGFETASTSSTAYPDAAS